MEVVNDNDIPVDGLDVRMDDSQSSVASIHARTRTRAGTRNGFGFDDDGGSGDGDGCETAADDGPAAAAAAAATAPTAKKRKAEADKRKRSTGSAGACATTATTNVKSTAVSTGRVDAEEPQATSAAATTTATVKKRPYIRTKRPAGYNDKSSITTTTDALWRSPLNVYDAVLQESKDLLQAAAEAQQLGRLKMASAYLLLLHARLVGLGKRFDKAPPTTATTTRTTTTTTTTHTLPPLKRESVVAHRPAAHPQAQTTAPQSTVAAQDTRVSHNPSPQKLHQQLHQQATTRPPVLNDTSAAALVHFLPSNIELDTAMMEHLARAAAELHAARCSGRHSAHASTTTPTPPPVNEDGNATNMTGAELLSNPKDATATCGPFSLSSGAHSPAVPHSAATGATPTSTSRPPYKRSLLLQSPNVGEFLASTANQRGVTNAATVTGVAQVRRLVAAPSLREVPVGPSAAAVASATSYTSRTFGTPWGPHHAAADADAATTTTTYLPPHTASPSASSMYSMTGRPLSQADMAGMTTSTTPLPSSETTGAMTTTPSSVANSSNHNNSSTSGARCKPVTTAMNTVPHANCDARALLQGAPFWQSDTKTSHTSPLVRTQSKVRTKQENV